MLMGQPRQMPLNTFQGWKYLLLVFILLIGSLLALPNIFGEDFAIQVSNKNGESVTQELLDELVEKYTEENITIKSQAIESGKGLIIFNSYDDQSAAKTITYQYISNHSDKKIREEIVSALNLTPDTPQWMKDAGLSPMKLGLDLRGGVYFLIQVDMDSLFEKEQQKSVSVIKAALREDRIYHEGVDVIDDRTVVARFKTSELRDQAFQKISQQSNDFEITDREENDLYKLFFKTTEQKINELQDFAITQNISTLNNRINAIGVAEPQVVRQGADRIEVQLPGLQDPVAARVLLGDTRSLEFRMVNQRRSAASVVGGRVPPDSELISEADGTPQLILKKVMLDGEHVVNAGTSADERGFPQINIQLDGEGGSIMARESGKNIGKLMSIILTETTPIFERDKNGDFVKTIEGELRKIDQTITKEAVSVATIQSTLGASFRITGQFSQQYASNLALTLKSGSLAAPIYIVDSRTTGPSLGKENVEKGQNSIIIGFVLVLLFMLARYKMFGLVANFALIFNLVLIFGMMGLIGAVLTLPGIAGIVLTVGMAVDANVLIFERIREELAEGVSPAQAIHNGYDRAFSTIADANITTSIAALILFAIGSGPVKGFAITLLFGILTSMFTAIFGSRALVNLIYGGKALKKVAI